MNDSALVGVIQRGAGHGNQVRDEVQLRFRVQIRDPGLGQVPALDQFHRDVGQVLLLVGVEYRDDARMGKASSGAGFPKQPLPEAAEFLRVGVLP